MYSNVGRTQCTMVWSCSSPADACSRSWRSLEWPKVLRLHNILNFFECFSLFSIIFTAAGWTPFHLYKGSTERDRNLNQTKQNAVLKGLLDKVRNSIHSTYFRMPVAYAAASASGSSSQGAAEAQAQDPIDLSVIANRLRLNDYYRSQAMMREDLLRMVREA